MLHIMGTVAVVWFTWHFVLPIAYYLLVGLVDTIRIIAKGN